MSRALQARRRYEASCMRRFQWVRKHLRDWSRSEFAAPATVETRPAPKLALEPTANDDWPKDDDWRNDGPSMTFQA